MIVNNKIRSKEFTEDFKNIIFSMKKAILYISFAYPPIGAVGSIRSAKITKYLYENGWIPHVVAGVPFSSPSAMNLQKEIPSHFVHHISFFDPMRFSHPKGIDHLSDNPLNPIINQFHEPTWKKVAKCLNNNRTIGNISKHFIPMSITRMPDRRFTWIKPAYKACMDILRQENIDLIFSSSSPPSCAIVASMVQKKSDLPWIAEFRDLWSRNHVDIKTRLFSWIEEKYERRVLKNASALVTVSEPFRQELIDLHNKPAYVIYNGFDVKDFENDVPLLKTFTITYTGSIYKYLQDPSPLFKAIAILKERDPPIVKNLKVKFFGKGYEKLIDFLAKSFDIEDYVSFCGEVDCLSAITAQKESSLLLLLEWNDPSAKGVIPGKLFEYLASGRPILAIGFPGAIYEMLKKTNSGILLNDSEEIVKFLRKSIGLFHRDPDLGFRANKREIKKFSRESQTKILIRIFNEYIS